jgi:hypothetical protein
LQVVGKVLQAQNAREKYEEVEGSLFVKKGLGMHVKDLPVLRFSQGEVRALVRSLGPMNRLLLKQ